MRLALVDCGRCIVPVGHNVYLWAANEGNIDRKKCPRICAFTTLRSMRSILIGVLRYLSLGSIVTLILGLPRSSKAFKAALNVFEAAELVLAPPGAHIDLQALKTASPS